MSAGRLPAQNAFYQPGMSVHNARQGEFIDLEQVQSENNQLHQLCIELEQALQEATQNGGGEAEARVKEYEALLEEKSQTICELHQQLQDARAQVAELEAQLANGQEVTGQSEHQGQGPAPREEELLALSEELERERRQLQEDEQTLMDQMREMEVTMARERAEMARQRNDLQRLESEVRHEVERLERNGALQSKIETLKSKLQDATTRRGAAPATGQNASPRQPSVAQPTPLPQPKGGGGFMGRLFGR